MQMGLSTIAVTNHHTKLFEWNHEGEISDEVVVNNGKSTHVNEDALTLKLDADTYADKRKNADGNYYTLTFPDDFVGTLNSKTTDPFYKYRSTSAPYQIDTPLNITINVPYGMSIGANTHAQHVKYWDVGSAWTNAHATDPTVGLPVNYMGVYHQGLISVPVNTNRYFGPYAASDPCILLDFNTNKVTETAMNKLTVTVDNSGNTIGSGGIGGSGGHKDKTYIKPGGGGGGGQGLHQTTIDGGSIAGGDREFMGGIKGASPYYLDHSEFSPDGDPYDGGAIWQDNAGGVPLYISSDGYSGPVFAGIGGQSGSMDAGADTRGQGGGANGEFGTLDAPGAGGAKGSGNGNRDDDLVAHHGSWGGNVVYLRSNVDISDATSTAARVTGMHVNIINQASGRMYGGGGGGAGGRLTVANDPQDGGDGGSLGAHGEATYTGAAGGAGALLFWNTTNVAPSSTIKNYSSHLIKGRDYLDGI